MFDAVHVFIPLLSWFVLKSSVRSALKTSLIMSVSVFAFLLEMDVTVTSEAMYWQGRGTVHCTICDERVTMFWDGNESRWWVSNLIFIVPIFASWSWTKQMRTMLQCINLKVGMVRCCDFKKWDWLVFGLDEILAMGNFVTLLSSAKDFLLSPWVLFDVNKSGAPWHFFEGDPWMNVDVRSHAVESLPGERPPRSFCSLVRLQRAAFSNTIRPKFWRVTSVEVLSVTTTPTANIDLDDFVVESSSSLLEVQIEEFMTRPDGDWKLRHKWIEISNGKSWCAAKNLQVWINLCASADVKWNARQISMNSGILLNSLDSSKRN